MLLSFSSYILVDTSSTTTTAGIIGGAIGGAVVLSIVLCIIMWCVVHFYKKKRSIYGITHLIPSQISFYNSKAANHDPSNVHELTNMKTNITEIDLGTDAGTCK